VEPSFELALLAGDLELSDALLLVEALLFVSLLDSPLSLLLSFELDEPLEP